MMLKPVLALAAAALLPSSALVAQAPAQSPDAWDFASEGNACMATAHSGSGGTTLSILASPTDGAFIFLVQNPGWQTLQDGEKYPVAVEFDDFGPWKIEAAARADIDADGPGLAFTVAPGREDGNGFIQEMITAGRMEIVAEGQAVGALNVTGSEQAMQGLATCLADRWANLDLEGVEGETIPASGEATPL
ncbi:hypothetical protein [Allosphingosinicella vermicomposti]|uniref:hypothetical protein n=1 Tax=Allosphingosinicella vermicomposti TaxID=614671 RepID=UPI000D0E4E48|nr:hypothetical protein [Allosphingosinicella vermicomposti]